MNFFKKVFFGSGTTGEESKASINDSYAPNDLTKIFKMEDFELILGVSLQEIQFCQFKRVERGGQVKETLFLNANLDMKSTEILIEQKKHTLIVLQINNEDYDSSQEQEPFKNLPITQDLSIVQYNGFSDDDEDQVIGFVFIYQDQNLAFSIETILDSKDKQRAQAQKDSFEQFRFVVCQILLALNEGKHFSKVAKKEFLKYSQDSSLDFIMKQNDLLAVFGPDYAKKTQALKARGARKPRKQYNKTEVQELIKKMSQLDIMKDEIKEMNQIQINIIQRLIQVQGDLLEYSPFIEENFERVKNVFLCIDQTDKFEYIINIIDLAGKTSYTRKTIVNSADVQVSSQDQAFMFTGNQRKGSKFTPGYVFQVYSKQDLQNLKGVLTKCLFEVRHQKDFDKEIEGDDNQFLQNQLESDTAGGKDVNMKEIDEELDDYEFQDALNTAAKLGSQPEYDDDFQKLLELVDYSCIQGSDFGDYEEEKKEDYRKNDDYYDYDNYRAQNDDDYRTQNDDSREISQPSTSNNQDQIYGDNRELIQAQSYDRTFILNGPVVKVYQNAEDSGIGNHYDHQRLNHCLDLPVIKDSQGNSINPSNLMLHNSESQLVFRNENEKSQVFMFDLESGKVVQQLKTGSDFIEFDRLVNETKNGQKDPDQCLIAMNQQGVYKLDPRIAKNNVADSKIYKTQTFFQSICSNTNGGFALGSTDGSIRMYKQMGQNAKTLLPGLGEPVIAIDVSQDEQWILATCQTYLLIIPTKLQDGTTGFSKSMGKDKPMPLKLTLKHQDIVKYQLQPMSFTPARFNNGDNIVEDSIVTSVRDLLITWNFEKVKRGVLRSYKIQKLPSKAVDGQFQYNNQERMLVTLPNNVKIETRKKVHRN
ncbi:UNKNOWN [Stylonychia lemnae]|uniref:Vacuolar import/degradation Vid27 C-terminal domain-containing protein n=1 Tax=Stylonychia lemnae TaxID=5949 RepID=A0A078AK89_STYLE|nr:UNKNOWN [Stylonychia lemnae]|eukprot:CDW81218.1 UNKNOWN [Stylonychia lemnae]